MVSFSKKCTKKRFYIFFHKFHDLTNSLWDIIRSLLCYFFFIFKGNFFLCLGILCIALKCWPPSFYSLFLFFSFENLRLVEWIIKTKYYLSSKQKKNKISLVHNSSELNSQDLHITVTYWCLYKLFSVS